MLNITRELVPFTMCGALLAAGSSASHASNVYKVAPSQADGVRITNPVCSCPAEVLAIFAKADDPNVRTDATVSDKPEQPSWSLEDESRYYDYGSMILGD